jgi:hypothetical protein
VADFTSESPADFISESVAGFARSHPNVGKAQEVAHLFAFEGRAPAPPPGPDKDPDGRKANGPSTLHRWLMRK